MVEEGETWFKAINCNESAELLNGVSPPLWHNVSPPLWLQCRLRGHTQPTQAYVKTHMMSVIPQPIIYLYKKNDQLPFCLYYCPHTIWNLSPRLLDCFYLTVTLYCTWWWKAHKTYARLLLFPWWHHTSSVGLVMWKNKGHRSRPW